MARATEAADRIRRVQRFDPGLLNAQQHLMAIVQGRAINPRPKRLWTGAAYLPGSPSKDGPALRDRMRTARQQMQKAMRADVPDEAAVKAASGAVASAQTDQALQRARAKAQLMKVLTPEQQQQLKALSAKPNRGARR